MGRVLITNFPKLAKEKRLQRIVWVRDILGMLLAAFAYYVLGRVGLLIGGAEWSVSPLWPASGLAVALVHICGRRYIISVFAGCLLLSLHILGQTPVGLGIALANSLEALVATVVLERILRTSKMHSPRQLIAYLFAAVLGSLVSVLVGLASLFLSFGLDALETSELFITWWAGNGIGILWLAPIFVSIGESRGFQVMFDRRMGERLAILAATLGFCYLGFGLPHGGAFLFGLYFMMLLTVIRLGAQDVKFLGTLVALIATVVTVMGKGPFIIGETHLNMACLQIFLFATALTYLSLCDFRILGTMRYTSVALILVWTMTAALSVFMGRLVALQDKAHMEQLSRQVVSAIRDRFRIYEDALRGGVGLFRASEFVERSEWQKYIASAEFMERYPGIEGVFVVWPVKEQQLPSFIERQSRDDAPGFSIWSHAEWGNSPRILGQEHYVIGLSEPERLRYSKLGLDLSAEKVRRETAEISRDSGIATLTSGVDLLPEHKSAFMLYLPFYKEIQKPASLEARRHDFMLWIVAVIGTNSFFADVLKPYSRELQISVFDETSGGDAKFLYSTHVADNNIPLFERDVQFNQSQHGFSLGLARAPGFDSAKDMTIAWIAGIGSLMALLLAGIVSVLGAMNRRSRETAEVLGDVNAKLINSERRFRELADSMPQMVWTLNLFGHMDYCNQRCQDFVGRRGRISARVFMRLMPKDQRRQYFQLWRKAVQQKSDFEMEAQIWDQRLEEYCWHLVRAVVVKDPFGNVLRWIGTNTNIHARKTASEALQISERRLRATIDQSPVAIQMIDKSGKISRVNRAWLEMWLRAEQDFVDGKFANYNVFEDIRLKNVGMLSYIERAFKGEPGYAPMVHFQDFYNLDPRTPRWAEIYFSPVRDESGEIVEVCLTYKDISPQVEAMEQIRLKQGELEAIMDHSPAVVYVKSPEGRFMMVNKQYRKLLADPNMPIIGKLEDEIWPPEFVAKFRENDLRVLHSRAPIQEEEVVPQADGVHTYLSAKFPLFDTKGEVRGICGISTDITLQRKAKIELDNLEIRERSALEASRLKSEFLANMSHEIRTPINGIIGMTKLLLDTGLSSQQVSYASSISKSSSLLLTLVNDILDLSKIEANKLQLELLPFNVEELIRDTQEFFEPLMHARGLSFQARMDVQKDRYYLGDPSRIRQVLNNLLSNAMKFTKSGQIGLDVSFVGVENSMVELHFRVWDTGIGISDLQQERLFEKFSQGDSSTARKFGGTGLGLAISRHLVQMMGGQIQCASRLGEGSSFEFNVRLKALEERDVLRLRGEDEAKGELEVSREKRHEKRVLVAEDNSINQEITIRQLEKAGYVADAVGNGIEALEAMARFDYDVVLMDCQMPELDGYEACRELRRRGFIQPVIALTANAFKEDRERCLDAGMTDYLVKPVSEEMLVQVLDRYLRLSLDPVERDREMMRIHGILDLSVIEKLRDLDRNGEKGFLRKLVHMYLEKVPKALEELRVEAKNSSGHSARIAHSLKSSCANLGVIRMAELLQRIEDGDFDSQELPHVIDELEREFKSAAEELENEISL